MKEGDLVEKLATHPQKTKFRTTDIVTIFMIEKVIVKTGASMSIYRQWKPL